MGKNEVFPYQINNLIKYDMIYEADENLIIHQYSNYLKIESIYQEESYQASLKISCKQVPSYSKEYTFNVIKPQENQISLNTSLLSNYLYDNEERPIDEPQVQKMELKEEGKLTPPCGPGFFDVADNLAMELLTLKTRK